MDDLNEALARVDDAEQAALTRMGIITGPTPAQMARSGCGGNGLCAIGIRDVHCPNCPS